MCRHSIVALRFTHVFHRALAAELDRDYVTFNDVQDLLASCVSHRIHPACPAGMILCLQYVSSLLLSCLVTVCTAVAIEDVLASTALPVARFGAIGTNAD
jgi:hypothetical protein